MAILASDHHHIYGSESHILMTARATVRELHPTSYLQLSTMYCTILSSTLSINAVRTHKCLMAWGVRTGGLLVVELCLLRDSWPAGWYFLKRKAWRGKKFIAGDAWHGANSRIWPSDNLMFLSFYKIHALYILWCYFLFFRWYNCIAVTEFPI